MLYFSDIGVEEKHCMNVDKFAHATLHKSERITKTFAEIARGTFTMHHTNVQIALNCFQFGISDWKVRILRTFPAFAGHYIQHC